MRVMQARPLSNRPIFRDSISVPKSATKYGEYDGGGNTNPAPHCYNANTADQETKGCARSSSD